MTAVELIVLIVLAFAGSCALAGLIGTAIRKADERTALGLDLIAPRDLTNAEVNSRFTQLLPELRAPDPVDRHFDTLPSREEEPC